MDFDQFDLPITLHIYERVNLIFFGKTFPVDFCPEVSAVILKMAV